MASSLENPARRHFVAGAGAIVVSFALSPRVVAAPEALPGSLKDSPLLDSWIRIDQNGAITVFTGKAELGQGIKTALIQLAAEELAVSPEQIALVTADTARTPNEGVTAGSQSMQNSGTAIRNAAAQARALLVRSAAAKLDVSETDLELANGSVRAKDGRSLSYGELARNEALHVNAVGQSSFATRRNIIGKSLPRVDIPAKVTGVPIYVQDLRLQDMVHARVMRAPSHVAKLRTLVAAGAERMPGVLKVVRNGSFVAVVAEREWQAINAMRALAANATWDDQASYPSPSQTYSHLRDLPANDTVIFGKDAAPVTGANVIEATYRRPYQMHGAIGPSCAVAYFDRDALTIWSHTQGVYPLRAAIADMLRMPTERVRCIHMEGSGCYGHNGADDAAAEAALIAIALPGRPVRLQWMREDEHTREPYGSAMIGVAKALVDASGTVSAFQYDVWSSTHSTRPSTAGNLAVSWQIDPPFAQPAPEAIPQPQGGGDRNAIPIYKFPRMRVVHHFIPAMPLRVSALRALGAYANIFSLESFVDELARAAHIDPVAFRLRYLDDERAKAVVRLAAERFGWQQFERGPTKGRGFAFARYKNLAAYLAIVMEVHAERDGRVRVMRVVAAVDAGEAVNPDGIRNQIEGGIVQSLSWSLYESVAYDQKHLLSVDWSTYPIMRFPSLPQSIDVHIIRAQDEPFLGTGEAAQGPTAAALANALADAIGARVRELPLSPERVRAAMPV